MIFPLKMLVEDVLGDHKELTRIFKIYVQVYKKSVRNGRQLKKYLLNSFIVTKTEADPEIRDYTVMHNDIVGGLYNDEDHYRQFRFNPGKQVQK